MIDHRKCPSSSVTVDRLGITTTPGQTASGPSGNGLTIALLLWSVD